MISQLCLCFRIHSWLPKSRFFVCFFFPWSLNINDALGSHCSGYGEELVLGLCWLLQAKNLVCSLTWGQLRSSSLIPDTACSSGLKSWELGTNLQPDMDCPYAVRSCCLLCTGTHGHMAAAQLCSLEASCCLPVPKACFYSLLLQGSCCTGMRGQPIAVPTVPAPCGARQDCCAAVTGSPAELLFFPTCSHCRIYTRDKLKAWPELCRANRCRPCTAPAV